jgi:hypothetical protein
LTLAAFNNPEPEPPGIDELLKWNAAFVLLAVLGDPIFGILSAAHFNCSSYERHVMDTTTFAAGSAPDQALINFNHMLASDAISLWTDHTGPQLMEYLEGGFIAGKPELALKLERGLAWRLSGDQITSPEPD